MAVIVTSPQLENACAEMWADPAEVAADMNIEASLAEAATIEATYIIWALSGYKYHGWQCWSEDYLLTKDMASKKFLLDKGPVETVLSLSQLDCASISGTSTALTGWAWDGRYLHLQDCGDMEGSPWTEICCNTPCRDVKLRVAYRIRPYLPPGAERVVRSLAKEYYNASTGGTCNLPDRITSVTRQGVSWTILDPQDFLQYGRVGIGPIDAWLATANRFGITRSFDSFYTPIKLYSTQTGCEEGCA